MMSMMGGRKADPGFKPPRNDSNEQRLSWTNFMEVEHSSFKHKILVAQLEWATKPDDTPTELGNNLFVIGIWDDTEKQESIRFYQNTTGRPEDEGIPVGWAKIRNGKEKGTFFWSGNCQGKWGNMNRCRPDSKFAFWIQLTPKKAPPKAGEQGYRTQKATVSEQGETGDDVPF